MVRSGPRAQGLGPPSEGQETQVTIHPPRRARMRRPVATAGPWVQIWDVDEAEGATAKAGDEADGR